MPSFLWVVNLWGKIKGLVYRWLKNKDFGRGIKLAGKAETRRKRKCDEKRY